VLHLCIEGGRFQPQESRCLRLIAAAFVERGFDQLNLVAFDCVVEVDAVVIEANLAVSASICTLTDNVCAIEAFCAFCPFCG